MPAAHREDKIILLDQQLFTLEIDAFEAFTAALDQSPFDNSKLRKVLETSAPWNC